MKDPPNSGAGITSARYSSSLIFLPHRVRLNFSPTIEALRSTKVYGSQTDLLMSEATGNPSKAPQTEGC